MLFLANQKLHTVNLIKLSFSHVTQFMFDLCEQNQLMWIIELLLIVLTVSLVFTIIIYCGAHMVSNFCKEVQRKTPV